MEYDHGHRVTPQLHELSALDRAVFEFEQKACHAHSHKCAPINETAEQRQKREKSLDKALIHLKAERALALAQVKVQVQLDDYRRSLAVSDDASFEDWEISQEAMKLEKHHPARVLGNFMRADGRPKPDTNFVAHHIIPGKGRTENAYNARIAMHSQGIRISDPDNGAWMPCTRKDKGHWSMPNCMAHSEIHTYNYERWIFDLVNNEYSETAFRGKLKSIQALIRDGNHNPSVALPPSAVKD
jgi:hypothetical protein